MKIVDIRTTVVGTPWRELTFVELVTDDGLVGLGEVRMVNKTDTLLACIGELGERHVIGRSPWDVEDITAAVQWREYGRVGEVAMSALAAMDLACWDLVGQSVGQPIWRLLGGQVRDHVPAYANGWYTGERSPASFAASARRVVERGYRALKIDPFGAATLELSPAARRDAVAILAAVRDAVGPDVDLMVEMHGRFTAAAAATAAAALEPSRPAWIEEPVPPYNVASLREIRRRTDLPIATGERHHTLGDLAPLIEGGLVDVLQADLTHFGGFTSLRKLAGWASVYDLVLAPHNVCGPVGTMANLHFAVATTNYKVLEHFNDFADPWVVDLVDGAPTVGVDGAFVVPDGPGLGVRLRPDVCARHPRTSAHFDLTADGWERRSPAAAGAAADR